MIETRHTELEADLPQQHLPVTQQLASQFMTTRTVIQVQTYVLWALMLLADSHGCKLTIVVDIEASNSCITEDL